MSLVEDIILASLESQRLIKMAELDAICGLSEDTTVCRAVLKEIEIQIFQMKEKHKA